VRQVGDSIWWVGMSTESRLGINDFSKGLAFTNVFHGKIRGNTITGEWADVPRGGILQGGTLALRVAQISIPPFFSGVSVIRKLSQTGGFGGSTWTLATDPPLPSGTVTASSADIRAKFDRVIKYGGAPWDTLYSQLKPEKDNAVVYGTITEPLGFSGYPPDGDGDITFRMRFDWAHLPPGFWTDGWLYRDGSDQVQDKLNQGGTIHPELILDGSPVGGGLPLLPGWNSSGANSVLWDRRPVNGDSSDLLGGANPAFGQRVRVTGVLALDCGHWSWFDSSDCHDDDAGEDNVEIHPLYSVDVIQDWRRRRPDADLTGVWAATDGGTYYVRQLGNTVWWLGLSADQGRTFANIFEGTIRTRTVDDRRVTRIEGEWADVPVGGSGSARNNGRLTIAGKFSTDPFADFIPAFPAADVRRSNLLETRFTANGIFGGYQWRKLYDVVKPSVQIP
jgi:hypothetical protein